ncbi:MAG TPA: MerR family transcriptional regulator [Nocardioidaceae bacterium]|nr:MerR family transcriptional regulator [Nocardioidaceae bacterium]
MLISELARSSGVPLPTVKYYLREGLLPPGVATSATRATYDESHLRRLRLIRALVDVGSLRLDAVRMILEAVDDNAVDLHDTIGAAHTALSPGGEASQRGRQAVEGLVRRHRWRVEEGSRNKEALAVALDAFDRLGQQPADETLDVYADAAAMVAKVDVASVPTAAAEDAVEFAVVGTVLFEPVLLALRRLAQEDASGRRLARRRVRTARRTRG